MIFPLVTEISKQFLHSDVKPADIHIVMLNSNSKTKKFFEHVKNQTNWRNKLYIIGFSSSRDSYLPDLIELFRYIFDQLLVYP